MVWLDVGVLLGTGVSVGVEVQTSVKVDGGGKSMFPLEVGDGKIRRKKKLDWVGDAVSVSHRVPVRLDVADGICIPVNGINWLATLVVSVGISVVVSMDRIRSK